MRDYRASLTAVAALASLALLLPVNTPAQRMPARTIAPLPAPAVSHSGNVRRAPTNGIRPTSSRTRSARANTDGGTKNGNGFNAADSFGFGSPLSIQQLLNIYPTNGFDWQYVNAINQDLPTQALINPVTQLQVAQAERLLRSTGGGSGGAYLLGGYGYYAPPETEGDQGSGEEQGPAPSQPAQPQVIVLQQAPAQQATQEESSAAPAEEQVPDQGQLILVLRNGKQIQAVAFTHAGDEIFYVTPDGARLSIPTSELDADATVRINQEKGTPLELNL